MPAVQARAKGGLAVMVGRSVERHLGGRLAKIGARLEVRERKGSRVSSWTDGEH